VSNLFYLLIWAELAFSLALAAYHAFFLFFAPRRPATRPRLLLVSSH
jgi:hypothetical protein